MTDYRLEAWFNLIYSHITDVLVVVNRINHLLPGGIAVADADIRAHAAKLKAAVDANTHNTLTAGDSQMATGIPSIDQLVADVAAEDTVIDSAVALINGFAKRLSDAIAAALAGGATAAQLADLTALSTDVQAKTKSLSDAVVAGTPATP